MNGAETMREFKNAVEVCEQLNEFSFRNIVKRNTGLFEKKGVKTPVEWSEYNRNAIRANAAEGFCALCGAEESCVKKGNRKFNLKYICHGSHSLDFCRSIRKNNGGKLFDDVRSHPEDWNFTPVLFLMENPSNQKKFGVEELTVYEQNEEGKCPSADWHWIYGGYNEEELIYPKKFINGAYGGLIASVVRMFRLGNAYVTDAVKCSMNCEEMFLGTDEYEPECVKKCCIENLKREIKLLTASGDRMIVFAFGIRATELAKEYCISDKTASIVSLPHPSSQRMSNENRKYVYFSKIYKTLKNRGFNCECALEEFLNNDTGAEAAQNVAEKIRNKEQLRIDIASIFLRSKDTEISACKTEGKRVSKNHFTIGVDDKNLYVELKFKHDGKTYVFGYNAHADKEPWAWNGSRYCNIGADETALKNLFDEFKKCLGFAAADSVDQAAIGDES